ncbi:MAG TPA: DUF3144 domain-containing protein [Steroidobacteraceae bacterium]|nr:DUF3144 domain-containing protein [Steroidobacteraceae bacterium]
MSTEADERFPGRADDLLRVASAQLAEAAPGEVSASLMYACARFSVWASASRRQTPAEFRRAYGETIERSVAEYRRMLVKCLDDYLADFERYRDDARQREAG